MKTTFSRIPTEDRLLLQAFLYSPDESTGAVVLHIHGMAGNFYENRFLDAMAKQFTDAGIAFLSLNTRGHDIIADFPLVSETEEYRRIGNAYEVFEESVLDIKAALDFLEGEQYGEIFLQGHSLGAVKVAYYMAETGDARVKKLVLASPPDMISLAEAESTFEQTVGMAQKMVEDGKGEELLPGMIWDGYMLAARTFLDLSLRGNPVDVFNTYAPEAASVLANVTVPTLAILGGRDDAVTIPSDRALEILKSKATGCPAFEARIIAGAPHSYFGHEQEVAEVISSWLV